VEFFINRKAFRAMRIAGCKLAARAGARGLRKMCQAGTSGIAPAEAVTARSCSRYRPIEEHIGKGRSGRLLAGIDHDFKAVSARCSNRTPRRQTGTGRLHHGEQRWRRRLRPHCHLGGFRAASVAKVRTGDRSHPASRQVDVAPGVAAGSGPCANGPQTSQAKHYFSTVHSFHLLLMRTTQAEKFLHELFMGFACKDQVNAILGTLRHIAEHQMPNAFGAFRWVYHRTQRPGKLPRSGIRVHTSQVMRLDDLERQASESLITRRFGESAPRNWTSDKLVRHHP
jgi:hypothetical protein